MENNLIAITGEEYGLEEKKAVQISSMFKPMLDKMVELEKEFNGVVKFEKINEKICVEAKTLLMKYVKVRTGTAEIHKQLKSFYLNGGRFVDGWKNAQLATSQSKEKKLKEISDYFINLEKEKVIKLQEKRETELLKFGVEVELCPRNLGEMDSDVWENYVFGIKTNFDRQKEAEEKTELERIAKEKATIEEQKRIKKENEDLKKQAEQKEKERKAREAVLEKERIEREAVLEKERIEREAVLEKERIEREAVLEKEREAVEKERKAREAVEKELIKKQQEEEKKQQEEEEQKQAELTKGDSEKVNDLINDFEKLKTKYSFKSIKNKKMYEETKLLIDKIIKFIK